MPARPVILADAVALAPIGTAAESTYAIGDVISLTLQSTTGYTSFAWRLIGFPAGSAAALSSTSGYTSSLTIDVAGEYRIQGVATGSDGTSSARVSVIVVLTPNRALRKVDRAAIQTNVASGLDDLVEKWNESLDTLDSTVLVSGAQSVVSRAALRALSVSTLVNRDVVNLGAAATAGDGWAGSFYYDSSSTDTDDGALTIAPTTGSGRYKRIYTGPIDVRWFGATGDGTTDDTAAIQAAIDASITSALGGTVWLPEGTYRITDTLTIASVSGLRFQGAGSGTLLKWDGTWVAEAYTPALKLWGCQRVEVGGFVLYVAATKRLSRGIQIATSGAGPYVSSRNVVHDMQMSCSGQIDTGIYVGGGTDANNDFHVIRNVTIQEFNRYGLHVSSLATQAYDITCENFFATGYTWRTTTCNCTGSSDTLTNIPANTFTAEDVGATIEVEGANYDTNGDPVRMVIAAILSTTSIQLTTNLIYHTLTGATLRYGAQAACNCAAGNVRWTGGAAGTSLDASFVLGITGSSGHSITNVNDEGSRVLLRSVSGTSGKGVTIDGVRFAGDSVVYDSASGWPYPAIAVSNPGPLEIRNSAIGDPFSGRDMRISWGPQGTDYGAWMFTMLDTHIEADTATSAAGVFTNLPPTDVVGGLYVASGVSKRVGLVERNHGGKSGATTLPMIWAAHKVTVTGTITFTFAKLPEGAGTRTRLHLVHSGGPHSVTFPAHTVVGSAFSHSGDDWFEFWTDGTTLWGKQL